MTRRRLSHAKMRATETSMTYRGKVQGGVVVLEAGASLADGTIVAVEPVTEARPTGSDDLASMTDLAVDTGIDDLATNIDHYLYGHPKHEPGDRNGD
jgi:hypothetical protein